MRRLSPESSQMTVKELNLTKLMVRDKVERSKYPRGGAYLTPATQPRRISRNTRRKGMCAIGRGAAAAWRHAV